ncbi:MAG: hypothetical protein JXR95_07875 [Deltaproteobacteria bacterium]|nr:hypothetical protein [Deltaproteobacteria bacterium]
MMKKLFIVPVILISFNILSCTEDETDPKVWTVKLDETKKDRKEALEKLEFIYEVDTTLDETCSEIMAKGAWDKRKREIVKQTQAGKERDQLMSAEEKTFNKYKRFCGKYGDKLKKKIPYFRDTVIPALLAALKSHDDWEKDTILKLLINFQDFDKPVKGTEIQETFIKIIEEFGGLKYLTNKEKVDARTVVAIKGLTDLNKVKPHPKTFEVMAALIKKIWKNPEQYDSISQVRLALVQNILKLRGEGKYVNKSFDKVAAQILVDLIRRGKHDTADEKYFCGGKHCKQNFLINKQAAVILGELGIANKDVNFTLVSCLYSVEVGLGSRRKSFRECKVALSKLYKKSLKGTSIDPVGILSLLAQGDPARYPLSYDSKKDLWYAFKNDAGDFVVYGDNKNQSEIRSKTVKSCMANYDKYRNSDYFVKSSRRIFREKLRFRGENYSKAKFEAELEKMRKDHKKRTDSYGEGACGVFVLNEKGGWDKKDSAVVERTAIEALIGMGASKELQTILLDTYSSFVMETYWDFTGDNSWESAKVRCKKEGMYPEAIKTNCVPKNDSRISGVKSQWNKLTDYNWLVDSSKEAMYGAGWLTTAVKTETEKRVLKELIYRLRWLKDPRSTTFAAKSIAMLPYNKDAFKAIMDVAVSEAKEVKKKDKKAAKRRGAAKKDEEEVVNKQEPWHIATELLWEQFRQQSFQLLSTGKAGVFCGRISSDKVKGECEKFMKNRFTAATTIFAQWSYNKDRWMRSRHIWMPILQDYFGYWPIDEKTKKPARLSPEKLYSEIRKWDDHCTKITKEFEKSPEGKKPDAASKAPVCEGYDTSKKYGWNIKASDSAKAMAKARLSAKEAEKRLILAGYERIRLDLLESAFDYSNVSDFDILLKVKPEHIMQDPGPHPLDAVKRDKLSEAQKIDYELMVQRPWNLLMEKDRRVRAAVVIKKELREMMRPIKRLRGFLAKYKNGSKDVDLNNISTLRTIFSTVNIQEKCPEKDKKGRIPSCAVFEDKYNDKTGKWDKIRLASMRTIVTPWKARRKALMLLNGWNKEMNPMDRKELVKVLAETYGASEVPVRKAILLVLDRWSVGADYELINKLIMKVIENETKNHRRGGYYWMNQDALSFLGRLRGK